jgi:tetratricopeptide (TPR) repeat protein
MTMKTSPALLAALIAALPVTPAVARKKDKLDELSILTLPVLQERGAHALRGGDAPGAIAAFAEVASRQPRDASSQALLGLSYHMAAATRPEAMDMALAGYDLAIRAEPGQFWPSAMAGRAAFEGGRYGDALSHFSRALLLRPTDARLVSAVAAAAYMSGDPGLASVAAERAVALSAHPDAATLRIAALATAAAGDGAASRKYVAALTAAFPQEAAATTARVGEILQTAPLDAPVAPVPGEVAPPETAPDQISVDVAIILSQNTSRERTGLNLLDGLRLQYGVARNVTRTTDRAGTDSYQRVITGSISVPQLNYNLNIFNRGGQMYSVVARPQLTAYKGEQSEFFIGRSLKVAVNGVNSSSLEQIDIGIEMKVTPIEITATGTRVRIETGRSFLTADAAGTFNEALTTFRQKVVATAEIRFGETLLLSGLNESVDDRTYSKTPLIGDLPLVGNAFNERNKVQRRDAVMVLVTPSRTTSLPGRPWARAEAVDRLAKFWTQVVDPSTNAAASQARLGHMRLFSRMARSDVAVPFSDPNRAAGEMLGDLLVPRSY